MDGAVDEFPLCEELFERGGTGGREAIEALVALVLFAPFAEEQALGFKATEERVKGALLNVDAVVGECFTERVAVVLFAELGEDGEDKAATAELKAEVLEDGLKGFGHTVLYTLYDTQCMASSEIVALANGGKKGGS
jgi:hypothetical protein